MDIPVVRGLHLAWFLAGLLDWVHRSIHTNSSELIYFLSKRVTKGYEDQAFLPTWWEKNSVDEAFVRSALVPKSFSNDFGGVN